MKKYFIVLISLLVTLSVFADNNDSKKKKENNSTEIIGLSGIVMDSESGELLAGVEVTLDEIDVKTYTDLDGRFNFEGIKPGEYNLSANYISYDNRSVKFKVKPTKNHLKIGLETAN